MAQLAQGFCFDLADTFTGNVELLAHLFQRAGAAIFQAKAQAQDLFFARGQGFQHIGQLLFQQGLAGGFGGNGGFLIGDKVAQVAIFLLTDGGFEADGFLCHAHNLAHFVHRHIQALGNFFGAGFMAVFVQQLAGNLFDLVDGFHHMHRDTDGAGLIRNGAGDGLADPPRCIGGELEALGMVKLFNRFDQTQVTFLDQVQELHAAAHIALCNGNYQTQVGFAQALLGAFAVLAAFLDIQGQLHFLIGGQQGHAADLFQVNLNGVIDGNAVRGNGILKVIHPLLAHIGHSGHISGVIIHHFNAVAFQLFIQLFHLLRVNNTAAFFHSVTDFGAGQFACTAALFNQVANRIFLFCHK